MDRWCFAVILVLFISLVRADEVPHKIVAYRSVQYFSRIFAESDANFEARVQNFLADSKALNESYQGAAQISKACGENAIVFGVSSVKTDFVFNERAVDGSNVLSIGLQGNVICEDRPLSPFQILQNEVKHVGEVAFVAHGYKPGRLKHIVLFRFKDSVTTEQKEEVRKRFLALKTKATRNGAPYIVSIGTAIQRSGEGHVDQGYIVTFASEGDRNFYVGKPLVSEEGSFDQAHDAFKSFVGPLLQEPADAAGAFIFDFRND